MIIKENTTWRAGETINLTSAVEIDHGATLTIEAGATVNGNGFSITTFGNLLMNGESDKKITLKDLSLEFPESYIAAGYVKLDCVNFIGGTFLASSGYGAFDVTNSIFQKVTGFYIWYPISPSTFVGNSFFGSEGLSVGTAEDGALLVKNNLFVGQSNGYAVEVWANYNDGINVVENSFLSTNLVALSIAEDYISPSMRVFNNYFGTNDLAVISSMILDRNDSLKRFSLIDIDNVSFVPNINTPSHVNSHPQGSVIVAGMPARGQVLTASNTLSDEDGIGTINYSWKANGTSVGIGSMYELQSTDVGKQITVTASYVDGFGITESVTSLPTSIITSVTPFQMVASTYKGNNFDEWIIGTAGGDVMLGDAGRDTLHGSGGNDVLNGGGDADSLDGGEGSDVYIIVSAADYVSEEDVDDSGTTGIDELRFASSAAATLTLTSKVNGIESIVIGSGTKSAAVTKGNVAINIDASQLSESLTIIGNAGSNMLTGGAGNDTLQGNAGADRFEVSAGTDTISDLGNGGSDVMIVSAGAVANANVIKAWTASASTVNYGTANLTTNGLAVNLTAVATPDTYGFTVTNMGTKAAKLTGSALADTLVGDLGKDVLVGNAGDDRLIGGKAADKLTGNAGTNTFVFAAGDSGQLKGFDVITDFQKGVVGIGDVIKYAVDLRIGGAETAASAAQANIDATTGIATFADKSGGTLADAIADIAASFTAVGDTAGDLALFRVKNVGSYYLFISDGVAGVGINDLVIQLTGLTSISGIDVSGDQLVITG